MKIQICNKFSKPAHIKWIKLHFVIIPWPSLGMGYDEFNAIRGITNFYC